MERLTAEEWREWRNGLNLTCTFEAHNQAKALDMSLVYVILSAHSVLIVSFGMKSQYKSFATLQVKMQRWLH